ncbi:hypothetical protein N431DRAFT_473864 [Stipitochalara longipes BDJ]|nr:hypothetical protein N431DRAFT_473864 [Stipitochalara longipes BDJ]
MAPQDYDKVNQNEDQYSESEALTERDLYSNYSRFSTSRSSRFILAVLVAFILGVLTTITTLETSTFFSWKKGTSTDHLLQDTFFPTFPTVRINFTNGGEYASFDATADQAWEDLVPLGAGYLRVPNPRQYELPPSYPLNDTKEHSEVYQASVIHQLHCLAYIRARSRGCDNGEMIPDSEKDDSHFHIVHCLEYLRQAIVCHADTTLEQGLLSGNFVGEGALHQCRDWSAVTEFLVKKRVFNSKKSILHT